MPIDDTYPPFLEVSEIKFKVESFRSRFDRCKKFPIDIEGIVERDLGISIQPIKGLRKSISIDAFVSSNFRILFVDEYEYMDARFENKLRFSFAHEISHLALHAELYRRQDFRDPESYIKFQASKSEKAYHWYESQANMFATRLLMPEKELLRVLKDVKSKLQGSGDPLIRIRSVDYLNDLTKSEAAEYFGVSEATLSNFIANERIIF
jgi:hypothetical protein